jgi:peroxiredoxin
VAVIAAAAAVCLVVARQYATGASPGTPESFRGKTVNLASITSSPSSRNVVLALSQSCHFCQDEMPFYRTLGESARGTKTHVYAVFPPAETASDQFLASRSVRVDGVASETLGALGVRGTPTVLVVDAKGKIERAWVGALNDAQKQELLQTVQSERRPS